jgi:hypothetical protein
MPARRTREDEEQPPLKPWSYYPKETALIEGCSVAEVYLRLGRGEYDGFKDGTRTRIPADTTLASSTSD